MIQSLVVQKPYHMIVNRWFRLRWNCRSIAIARLRI